MKRFKCVSLFGSDFTDYKMPKQDNGPYIVDDSNFIPMSETIKQLSKTAPLGRGVIEGVYDFPDGVDDGRKVDVARLRPEIVELSEEVRKQQKSLKKKLREAQEIAQDRINLQQLSSKTSVTEPVSNKSNA